MTNKIKIFSIIGTRPEAIKMSSVIWELDRYKDRISNQICVTAQHRELLDDVLTLFDVCPDYDLNIMEKDQTPEQVVSLILTRLKPILLSVMPDWVLVQGDTTTAMAAALAVFYSKIKIGHIEAGLRTHDNEAPFPEEVHRRIISCLASYHFPPTDDAKANLLAEGISAEKILVTGNTGIDTLLLATKEETQLSAIFSLKNDQIVERIKKSLGRKKLILVTVHRRENHGKPMVDICYALRKIAEEKQQDIKIVFIIHPNPAVHETAYSILGNIPNIDLLPPLDYLSFIKLLKHTYLILTDSGGIQEEAPALGIPLLVLRNKTERCESALNETSILVGTQPDLIISEINKLITDDTLYSKLAAPSFPYGDGHAARRIADFFLGKAPKPFIMK